jgi:hypothetical protein
VVEGTCDRVAPPARHTPSGQVIYCHRELDELRAAQAKGGVLRA